MPRPCQPLHPLKAAGAGCHWCDLFHSHPGYRARWGDDPPPTGILARSVRWCKARGRWEWRVTDGPTTIAQGHESDEAEAWAEANAVGPPDDAR